MSNSMSPEGRAICRALLDHHHTSVKQRPPGKAIVPAQYTIRYSDLCARAGVPHLTRIIGSFLAEVAEWCDANGYPPLNALAVNDTGMPGGGYDGAGGFKIIDWPTEVEDCIRYMSYPARL